MSVALGGEDANVVADEEAQVGPQCREARSVELLSVDRVSPGEAQFGDSVQIVGDGFGLGSPASVTLRGDVHRAGRPPEPVQVVLRAQTESQRELTLTLPRDVERAFCGEPDEASHATFHGDIEVAIAARALGAPPATGQLRDVRLELELGGVTTLALDERVEFAA